MTVARISLGGKNVAPATLEAETEASLLVDKSKIGNKHSETLI